MFRSAGFQPATVAARDGCATFGITDYREMRPTKSRDDSSNRAGKDYPFDGMNVLLLYPEFPDTFWGFKHALRFIRKKAAFPPLGLLTVAAMLPPEWEKRLVD